MVLLALLLGALFTTSAEAASKRVGVPKFDGVQTVYGMGYRWVE